MNEKINVDDFRLIEIARIAIEEYEVRRQKKQSEKAFHNTKLLMENYNDFVDHIKYSVSDINDIQSIVTLDLKENYCDELFISSIKQSKARTLVMVTQIEVAMKLLEEKEKRENTIDKYRALEMYYIKEKTYAKIAEELNTGINTPRIWIKEMINKLGNFLFGVDNIKLL
ncbi:hypothetical protein DVW05_10115 [Clostridium botulinum]|nr:hypothetical protein [Clostridium botulinum]